MLVQLLLLVFCQTILAGRVGKPFYDTNDYETMGSHFEEYLVKHDKNYDATEKALRFGYFITNVMQINELNKHYKAIFDVNHLTDWSEDEKKTLLGVPDVRNIGDGPDGICEVKGDPGTQDAPAAFDWRAHGAVSPVKDQARCGSCWAFGATGLVESRMMQLGKQPILSEQQLVDCDTTSNGCNGGFPSLALTYLMHDAGGQMTEESYPYEAASGYCRYNPADIAARVQFCSDYSLSSEDALKELLYHEGPLAIVVDASTWSSYQGGIFDDCGNQNLDHAVLLVGYGSENGEDFWVIKNSWGQAFGEQGFIRIKRGVNCCAIGGIGMGRSYAVVSATVA